VTLRERLLVAAGERRGALRAYVAMGLVASVDSAGARVELAVIEMLVALVK
jgi:hypothetical protein